MKVSLFFAWYDFWVGIFYDQKKRVLYICPLPCCVIKIEQQPLLHAIADTIPVAEALAALRIEWTHQKAHYDNSQDDILWERGQELETRLRELDATIARLGLAEETK